MAGTWYKMAKDVLHAPKKATKPVGEMVNQANREWTDFNKPYNEAAAHELKFLRKR
jgi:hypothetical protein